MDTVPIFGAEAPGTAAVEVDVEAPNPATTTASVVSSIAMDSGEEIENVKIGIGVSCHHQESHSVYLAGRLN